MKMESLGSEVKVGGCFKQQQRTKLSTALREARGGSHTPQYSSCLQRQHIGRLARTLACRPWCYGPGDSNRGRVRWEEREVHVVCGSYGGEVDRRSLRHICSLFLNVLRRLESNVSVH